MNVLSITAKVILPPRFPGFSYIRTTLAWPVSTSPVPPVNQIKSKRAAANTLWRVPVEIKN